MKELGVLLIKFYKRFISSMTPKTCIYTPTCSMYTMEAIKRFGFMKGVVMGAKRILRCTPLYQGGFDPVPDNFRGNAKWLI